MGVSGLTPKIQIYFSGGITMRHKNFFIASKKFILSNDRIRELTKKGYSRLTQENIKIYIKRFHVYKNYIDCEIIVSESNGSVDIDVINTQMGLPYPPFYRIEDKSHNNVVKRINKSIYAELKEIGAITV